MPGQVFGLLGPNGSGKTTTLSVLMGIVKQSSGNFTWFGNEHGKNYHRFIGALIETPNFYPYLTALQNLKITARIKNIPAGDIERVLGITELSERKDYRYDTFSLGMKQRLAIAGVLLGNPQVLVLDEPANGLDPQGIAAIRNIIKNEASQGKTIILASHILDEVEKVCSHALILKRGNALTHGRVSELLSSAVYIFVSCENNKGLFELLVRSGKGKRVTEENNGVLIEVNSAEDAPAINKLAIDNGFILHKLETRTRNLEDRFIELINK